MLSDWKARAIATRLGRLARTVLALGLLGSPAPVSAQTIGDGIMLQKKTLFTGVTYGYDSWDEYWEGTLKRDNGNVGTLTTQSITWSGNYGITDRLNVIAQVPYVWTHASGGTLQGQSGFQDLTLAAKFNLFEMGFTKGGTLRTVVVGAFATPLTDYVPDLLPLSIGIHSSRASGRLTLMYLSKPGFFVNATGAYTWRGNVKLDRPAYFTDGQQFLSDEAQLPDVFDYMVSVGFMNERWQIPFSFYQQRTQGGGDIRRQDMPFPSNRMDASKLDGMVMYYLPKPRNLAVRFSGTYAIEGRNVGQATTFTAGLLYNFKF